MTHEEVPQVEEEGLHQVALLLRKEGKEALEAIQSDLALFEASLAEVSTLIAGGDYLTALDKVKAAKEKATSLKTELEEAIARKSMKKPM